jgi:ribose/xylose/arabinose/galactoside ABC-type transport system permease subunit
MSAQDSTLAATGRTEPGFARAAAGRLRRSDNVRTYLPLIAAILALGTYASLNSDLFLTSQNLVVLLDSISVLGLITVGMTLLLIAGQIDLSVGTCAALASVVAAKLIAGGTADVIAVLAMLAVPVSVGLLVGLVVVKTGVQPFILTLGLLSFLQSISLIETGQRPVPVGSHLQGLDTAVLAGIPLSFWIFVVALLVCGAILHFTRFGRNAYAVGSNADAAYLSGIPVGRVKVLVFCISGLLVGVAGMLLLASLGAGDASSGTGLELDAIAAAVIGGASLLGGRGTMLGSFLGVMLLGVLSNSLTLLDVSSFYQRLILGALLMIAVVATAIAEKRRGAVHPMGATLRRWITPRRPVGAPAPETVPSIPVENERKDDRP